MKLTKQERAKVIRAHPDKTADELAAILNVSSRSIERDRKALRPDIPDTTAPVSSDPITNLREQQRHLRESLKVMSIGSETYRKTLGNISELEMHIAKLTKPGSDVTEYEFVAYLDSGCAVCRSLVDAPENVQAAISRAGDEMSDVDLARVKLANEAGERYAAAQADRQCSSAERQLRHDEWNAALSQVG